MTYPIEWNHRLLPSHAPIEFGVGDN